MRVGLALLLFLIATEGSVEGAMEGPLRVRSRTARPASARTEVQADTRIRSIRNGELRRGWSLKGMDALQARHVDPDDRPVVVAVIDTGIDLQHPDLRGHIWINQGESGLDTKGQHKEINGVDDDGNGFIDDVHGWNFVQQTADVSDHHGHGTHVTGIITSVVQRNTIGASAHPQIQFMILKYAEPSESTGGSVMNTVEAIRYATRMGAQIINYSAGGTSPSSIEERVISEAAQAGILFVAAAGNESSNSDLHAYFPADYELPNILSVASSDQKRRLLPSSNFGLRSVDFVAPGKDILSTLPGGNHGRLSGTSQAAAFATGVAALVMEKYHLRRDPGRIIEALARTGDWDSQLEGKTRYGTHLNPYRALAIEGWGSTALGLIEERPKRPSGEVPSELMILADALSHPENHRDPVRKERAVALDLEPDHATDHSQNAQH